MGIFERERNLQVKAKKTPAVAIKFIPLDDLDALA